MIPQIQEINFPSYATLHQATANFARMGDRTISTQVRIDGDIVPSFEGWELSLNGERFVLPIRDPQATKDNSTLNSLIDLNFQSWAIYQMKRYFFFETTTTATGTVMADKYKTPINLDVVDFCALLNRVLNFYFNGKIVVDLYAGAERGAAASLEIDYSYIWDVILFINKIYGLAWNITYNSTTDVYVIKVGYPEDTLDFHEFEYGYSGGLSKFERQVQDENIYNVVLGRGGEQNVPYRYFKDTDPDNPEWAADPDAIPELANIYFDRIRDINFRKYVQGWRTNENGILGAIDEYDAERAATDWAYEKGHTDTQFDPVEYVKDDDSIAKYGERWGALEDNDEIFPTIQGIFRGPIGRVDEVVAVSEITTDDMDAASSDAAQIISINGVTSQTNSIDAHGSITTRIIGSSFTIPEGSTGRLENNDWYATSRYARGAMAAMIYVDTTHSWIRVFNQATEAEVSPEAIPAGTYYYTLDVTVKNDGEIAIEDVTYGVNGLYLAVTSQTTDAWKPTFDIWIKNIFYDKPQTAGETDEEYAERIWSEVLGDRLGNEAKIVFSDGFMSVSEDYEFVIASYPVVDRTKISADGKYRSEWKLTLFKSNAEYDATGLYIPNATSGGKPIAGDHFFFVGIDMPHFYVVAAEQRVNDYKVANMNHQSEINPVWVVNFDKVRINQLEPGDVELLCSRIKTGAKIRVKDKRFTNNQTLELYIQSITYTWNEPTDTNPYLYPDIEVVLSEKIEDSGSVVEQMRGDIDILKSTSVKVDDMDAIVTQVATPKFMRKTGENELSLSPTRFSSLVASKDFKQGDYAGTGWGFYRDNSGNYQPTLAYANIGGDEEENVQTRDAQEETTETPTIGDAVLEVDRLTVRKEMHVNSIVVNQITYIGGKQILSAAAIECVQVVETEDSYICYFDQKQGSVQNLFEVDDIAMAQVFDPSGTEVRFYKMIVSATDVDSITLAKRGGTGTSWPRKGDIIVQYGNITQKGRQYAIIHDVIGGGYLSMVSDLNSVNATGNEYFFAGISQREGDGYLTLKDSDGNTLKDSNGKVLLVRGNPLPKLFMGDEYSYIEYSRKDSAFYVKGALVVSPAGVEFPVPCYRGSYYPTEPYYYGDVVVHDGRVWMHYGKEETRGVAPVVGDVWDIYSDKGSNGDPGQIYELRPNVAQVKRRSDGSYSVQSVTCQKIKHIGLDFIIATDGVLKYSIDGGQEQEYSGAILSSSFTSTIVFTLYVDNNVVALTTVSMVGDGAQGDIGRTIRFGEWDPNSEYLGQNDETPGLQYIDVVVYNNHSYLCLRTHNSSGSDPKVPPQNTSGSNPYWLLADERQFVAAKAMVVDQAFIDRLAIGTRLTTDVGANEGYTDIIKGKASFFKTNGVPTTAIHSGELDESAVGQTTTMPVQTSVQMSSESATVQLSTAGVAVSSSGNYMEVPQITLTPSGSSIDIDYEIFFATDAAGSNKQTIVSSSITQPQAVTLGARSISLPAASGSGTTFNLYIAYTINEGDSFTFATTSPWTLHSNAYTVEIAANGMKAKFGNEGIKATSAGAKVIQGGTEYDMIGGVGGIKRIAVVSAYPATEDPNTLYIKIAS